MPKHALFTEGSSGGKHRLVVEDAAATIASVNAGAHTIDSVAWDAGVGKWVLTWHKSADGADTSVAWTDFGGNVHGTVLYYGTLSGTYQLDDYVSDSSSRSPQSVRIGRGNLPGTVVVKEWTAGTVAHGGQHVFAPLFSDDFNRANGAVGNGWTNRSGTLDIASNRLFATAAGFVTRTMPSPNIDMSITLTGGPGDTLSDGFALRWSGGGNYYLIRPGDAYRVTGGSFTQIVSGTSTPPAAGSIFRLVVTGTSFTGYINGAAFISGTLTGNQNPTSVEHGPYMGQASRYVDDFSLSP